MKFGIDINYNEYDEENSDNMDNDNLDYYINSGEDSDYFDDNELYYNNYKSSIEIKAE